MANEITFGYRSGATLKYAVYHSDGTEMTAPTTDLPEILATGYYTADDALVSTGDIVIVLEGGDVVGYGVYQPKSIVANPTAVADAVWDEDITTHNIVDSAGELIQSLVQVFAGLPLPSISIDTIKTILQFTDTEYDDQLTLLIPIIEDVVVQYCGVSTISDLSVGAIFPIAGLVRYAMENPIGAKLQQVGSDRTEYGEFPNALLKLLDNFKPDTEGGYANAEVINLNDINEDLGI